MTSVKRIATWVAVNRVLVGVIETVRNALLGGRRGISVYDVLRGVIDRALEFGRERVECEDSRGDAYKVDYQTPPCFFKIREAPSPHDPWNDDIEYNRQEPSLIGAISIHGEPQVHVA